VIAEVDIKHEVRSIKEWDEGYEELKAIPHSFVVELAQRDEIWMMYTDTEDEKVMFDDLLKLILILKYTSST
jgi:MAP7 domain-containing protein 1